MYAFFRETADHGLRESRVGTEPMVGTVGVGKTDVRSPWAWLVSAMAWRGPGVGFVAATDPRAQARVQMEVEVAMALRSTTM